MDRPNVLLILLDSAQAGVFGAYGGACRTPHADRIAAEGVRLTHAFTTAPICHPARASIATGLLPHGHGFICNRCGRGAYPFNVHPGTLTLAEMLAGAGYRCGYAGQGHIDVVGYHDDRSIPTHQFTGDLHARGLAERVVPERSFRGCGRSALDLVDARDAQFAHAAAGLIEEYAGQDEPWFVQCDFDGPHPPCVVPEPFDQLHALADVQVPESVTDSLEGKPDVHRVNRAAQGTAAWSARDWRVFTAHYYGMVAMLDALVGGLLDRLDELALTDSTVVILTSDHGGMCGAHGFLNHGTPAMFEEAMRVPLMVRCPGVFPAGLQLDGMVSHVDLVPTIIELAGTTVRGNCHGRSWVRCAMGEGPPDWPGAAMGQFHGTGVTFHSARMLRTHRWNYVWHPSAGEELYDVQSDPHEMDNLAGREVAGPVLPEIRRMMGQHMAETDDPLADTSLWRELAGG